MGRKRTTEVTARTLRCLAHPLRLRLLNLLQDSGPATATGLAAQVGENSANISWHLRQLAAAGFIEHDTERGNRRERWWRALHDEVDLTDPALLVDPNLAEPLTDFLHEVAAHAYERTSRAIAELPNWPQEWKTSATLSQHRLSLTAAESAELNRKMLDLVLSYERPPREGDAEVVVHRQVFPTRFGRPE